MNRLASARAGGDLCMGSLGTSEKLTPSQSSALGRVRRRVAAYGPCPKDLSPRGAHVELLKTTDVYCEEGRGLREPFDRERIKLLSHDMEPQEASELALAHVREELLNPEKFIERNDLEMEDEPLIKPYWDPLLDPSTRANRPRLVSFLRELAMRGQVCATLRRRADVGPFFVRKKTVALRMILDARQTNQMHRAPPHATMASVEAVASVTVGQSWMRRADAN